MQNSQALADSKLSAEVVSTLAKPLAPEDVRAGNFVTLLHVTYELPSYLWSAESFQLPHDQPVRIQLIPEESGAPLKVDLSAFLLPLSKIRPASTKRSTYVNAASRGSTKTTPKSPGKP